MKDDVIHCCFLTSFWQRNLSTYANTSRPWRKLMPTPKPIPFLLDLISKSQLRSVKCPDSTFLTGKFNLIMPNVTICYCFPVNMQVVSSIYDVLNYPTLAHFNFSPFTLHFTTTFLLHLSNLLKCLFYNQSTLYPQAILWTLPSPYFFKWNLTIPRRHWFFCNHQVKIFIYSNASYFRARVKILSLVLITAFISFLLYPEHKERKKNRKYVFSTLLSIRVGLGNFSFFHSLMTRVWMTYQILKHCCFIRCPLIILKYPVLWVFGT